MFKHSRYSLSFLLLLLLPFSNAIAVTTVSSVCGVTKTIQADQWTQIGIPCEAPADQNTIAAIFSDDILGIYDTDWVLFSFNPINNAYEKPALTDTVEVGKGYWIISANQTVTLDMPLGSQPVSIQSSTQCFFEAGCYETTLVTKPEAAQYQMLASPFENPFLGETLRINSGLETGLTLDDPDTETIFYHKLWSYNGTIYDEIQNQIISPWTGFWGRNSPTASNSPAPKLLFPSTQTQVNLHVTETTGAILTDVNITALKNGIKQSMVTLTETSGEIAFPLEPEIEYTLSFSKQGFANQIQRIKTPAAGQKVNLDVLLIPRGIQQTVSNQPDMTLSGTDGASVSLSNPQFVDPQGNTVNVSDGVNLTITSIDVSTPAGVAAFPGDFLGTTTGESTPTPIVSYGTVEYQFTRSSDGEELQLQTGQQADILLPIYVTKHQDGSDIVAGDIIPLWSLNEITGIWTQEGTGTVVESTVSPTGFALQATVAHFSWWNADAFMEMANAIVTVTAPSSGTAIISARITSSEGGAWSSSYIDGVIPLGVSSNLLPIPAGREVCFSAVINYTEGTNTTTPEICLTTEADATENISLEATATPFSLTTMSGTNISTYINVPAVPINIRPSTPETSVSYVIESGFLPTGVSLSPTEDSKIVSISGVPMESGNFNVVVKGSNGNGETSLISINYNVNGGTSAPLLVADSSLLTLFYNGSEYSRVYAYGRTRTSSNHGGYEAVEFIDQDDELALDMNRANRGGGVNTWSVSNISIITEVEYDEENGYIAGWSSENEVDSHSSISIDSATGTLLIKEIIPSDFDPSSPLQETTGIGAEIFVRATNELGSSLMQVFVLFDQGPYYY